MCAHACSCACACMKRRVGVHVAYAKLRINAATRAEALLVPQFYIAASPSGVGGATIFEKRPLHSL